MHYVDHIADILGTQKWVVAPRLTTRLRRKGYELAVSQKRFTAVWEEAQRREARDLAGTPKTIKLPRKGPHDWSDRLVFDPITEDHGRDGGFTISPARYAKLKVIVNTRGNDGFKSRACRLAGAISRNKYTKRCSGYVMSPAQAEKFYKLFHEGRDASIFGKLGAPKGRACYVYVSALAKFVHARGQRFQCTGRVRDAEQKYDRHFIGTRGLIEPTSDGVRLVSPDGALCFNLPASSEGQLFRYAL